MSMPDILDSDAPTGVSEPRLRLATCLWEVTSPQTILAASSVGAGERLQRVLERHRTLLASLGLLESLEGVVRSQSPFARFMLIHSPFEFLLEQLDEDPQREREDHNYLEERFGDFPGTSSSSHPQAARLDFRTNRAPMISPGMSLCAFFGSPWRTRHSCDATLRTMECTLLKTSVCRGNFYVRTARRMRFNIGERCLRKLWSSLRRRRRSSRRISPPF